MSKWWMIEAVDPLGSKPWMMRVPARTGEKAVERLWRFGMVTGTPVPWQLVPDPEFQRSRRENEEYRRDSGAGRSCHMSAHGRVSQAAFCSTSEFADLLSVIDLEAEPVHRHYLLQEFCDRRKYPVGEACEETRLWACWQWMAEWPLFCQQWLEKDDDGECQCIPDVSPPYFLATMLDLHGDPRAQWINEVVDKCERMSHQDDPPRLRLW